MLVVVGLRCGLCPWAGCDDDSGDGDDGHDSFESGDLEADGDSEGMVKEFRSGSAREGVPTWTLEVRDHSGAVVGAMPTVTPTMPEHSYGSQRVAEGTVDGDGQYTAMPVDLRMAGLWQVEMAIDGGETIDEVHFVFEIAEL